jgi:maltose alpha-D-glucosyltransferase/alpha-amylase
VRHEALETLGLLERRSGQLPVHAHLEAQTLLERRRELLAHIDAGTLPRGRGLKTRYHGDYHLGQVLLRTNDFVIIDFEGEPGRPLEARRAKHSPLRDVAGMLRSFDYARWAALRHANQGAEEDGPLAEPARAWLEQTRATFLRAYAEVAGASELYGSFDEARGLLALFELEKALYELRYELGNRPDWARIPLLGILALLGG